MSESEAPSEDQGSGEPGPTENESNDRRSARRSNSPSTPFDYPLVSPIFLLVLAAWFGYDGWFNPATKSIMFNRVVFGFLLLGALWTLNVDLKIMRIQKEKKAADEGSSQEEPEDPS